MKRRRLIISVISAVLCVGIAGSILISVSSSANNTAMFRSTGLKTENLDFSRDYPSNSAAPSALSPVNHAGNGYVKKAETSSLELYLKQDLYKQPAGEGATFQQRYDIALYDKNSKHLWTGIVPDSSIDYQNLGDGVVSAMQSLVTFDYVDFDRDKTKTIFTNPILLGCGMTAQTIENGVELQYNIPSLSISFNVDFMITGDIFDVTVPPDKIQDNLKDYNGIQKSRAKFDTVVSKFQSAVTEASKVDVSMLDSGSQELASTALQNMSNRLLKFSQNTAANGIDSSQIDLFNQDIALLETSYTETDAQKNSVKKIESINNEMQKYAEIFSKKRLCGVTDINVLPYFGAGTSKTDGYAFYPDECGAISYFNQFHSQTAGSFSGDVYSNHITDISLYGGLKSSLEYTEQDAAAANSAQAKATLTTVTMPVFGVKNGNSAFVGIIAQGDTDARISYTPSTPTYDVSTVNSTFYLRNISQTTNSDNTTYNVVDPDLLMQQHRLRYVFLSGDDADYSGMAVAYRNYLEEYGLLNQSNYLKKESNMPMNLEFFMGVKSSTGTSTKYVSMTKYSDAQKMLEQLKDSGVNQMNVDLRGWSDTGFYDNYPDYRNAPAGGSGGKSGLTSLTNFANRNNIPIGLETQYVFGNKTDMHYHDVDAATVKVYGKLPLNYDNDYMYNPTVLFNRAVSALSTFKKYGIDAVTYYREGYMIYQDYNTNGSYNRAQTQAVMRGVGQQTRDKLGYANYDSPNINLASQADWMLYLPEQNSEFLYEDEQVPFYQMVVHGSILYTGDAFNAMHDQTAQKLQAVEYGYAPFYFLTQEEPNVKGNDNLFFLYATVASNWMNDIVSDYKNYSGSLSKVWKAKMMSDETVNGNDNLKVVTYDNGCKVIVNYGNSTQTVDGVTVEPLNYRVVEGLKQ